MPRVLHSLVPAALTALGVAVCAGVDAAGPPTAVSNLPVVTPERPRAKAKKPNVEAKKAAEHAKGQERKPPQDGKK